MCNAFLRIFHAVTPSLPKAALCGSDARAPISTWKPRPAGAEQVASSWVAGWAPAVASAPCRGLPPTPLHGTGANSTAPGGVARSKSQTPPARGCPPGTSLLLRQGPSLWSGPPRADLCTGHRRTILLKYNVSVYSEIRRKHRIQ